MATSATTSLNELETTLDAASVHMQQLFDDNARLRSELAEVRERMRAAGHKLRVVAERLPQAAVAVDTADTVDTSGAEISQERAA